MMRSSANVESQIPSTQLRNIDSHKKTTTTAHYYRIPLRVSSPKEDEHDAFRRVEPALAELFEPL